MNSRTIRRGLSLVDLCAAIVVLAMLSTICLAAVNATTERNYRTKCAQNLGQIGKGLILYANDNRGIYPRTRASYDAKLTVFTGSDAKEPFDEKGPELNDITAAYFLLCRTEDLGLDVFVCPSTTATTFDAKPVTSKSNFPSIDNLSYSFANPYYNKEAGKKGYRLSASLPQGFAVAADMNPGGDALLKTAKGATGDALHAINSKNHVGDGQNVLYSDGHVTFEATPFVGVEEDNIYTFGDSTKAGGDGIWGSPASAIDSVLLPTPDGPPKQEKK